MNLAEILKGALVALEMEIDLVPAVCRRAVTFQLIQEREIFFGIFLGPLCHEQHLFTKKWNGVGYVYTENAIVRRCPSL